MNKKILRTLTALCAALMLTGGFSVTHGNQFSIISQI